jgi:metallo-beta-lactamase family protein
VPLFSEEDVEAAIPLLRGVPYGKPIALSEATQVTLHEAGHILGSACLEFVIQAPGGAVKVMFSGDLGQWNKPIIRDPTLFREADYVVMETTYGDRDHPPAGDIEFELERIIHDTVQRGGNLVIPIFAVERAQEVVYYLSRLVHAGRIPQLPVFLDSPMAVDVTEVFCNYREFFDQETWQLIMSNQSPLRFPGLTMVRDKQQSKAINALKQPCIIMSTSGMCTAGRIKHHLRMNIVRPDSTILFVGYQAHGTLGRQILDGNPLVRIHGRQWKVKAQIARLEGFSGHADRQGLLRWVGHLERPPRHIFLTHGEATAAERFAELLRDKVSSPVSIPQYRQVEVLAASAAP